MLGGGWFQQNKMSTHPQKVMMGRRCVVRFELFCFFIFWWRRLKEYVTPSHQSAFNQTFPHDTPPVTP